MGGKKKTNGEERGSESANCFLNFTFPYFFLSHTLCDSFNLCLSALLQDANEVSKKTRGMRYAAHSRPMNSLTPEIFFICRAYVLSARSQCLEAENQ